MLLWGQDGVEVCRSFLSPVLEGFEACGNRAQRLPALESRKLGS